MQYKFLTKTEIDNLKNLGVKLVIWEHRSIHSVLNGTLHFCEIQTEIPKDQTTNDSFDLN